MLTEPHRSVSTGTGACSSGRLDDAPALDYLLVQVRTGEVGALPVTSKLMEPPASRLPLQPASAPITFAPLCVSVAFHALPTVCPSANAHPTVLR